VLKFNIDAAVQAGSCFGSTIVRDYCGDALWVGSEIFQAYSLLFAELYMIREALLLAESKAWRTLIVETDSQEAVSLLNSDKFAAHWPVQVFVEDISVCYAEMSFGT